MPVYKDDVTGTWYASFYYGKERKRKLTRGFATKREALEYEREFIRQKANDLTMTFESFVEVYIGCKKSHSIAYLADQKQRYQQQTITIF